MKQKRTAATQTCLSKYSPICQLQTVLTAPQCAGYGSLTLSNWKWHFKYAETFKLVSVNKYFFNQMIPRYISLNIPVRLQAFGFHGQSMVLTDDCSISLLNNSILINNNA